MKTKRIIKVVAFCLILFLFLNHIYDVFSWKDTAGDYYSSVDTFYELDEDLADVMFLGSSRCYCTINNAHLWNEFGIASFSMSISGQDIVSSYHSLVEGLKTQTPDVVCLELYGTLFDGYGVESNLYRNSLPFNPSVNAWKLVNEIGGDIKTDLIVKWPIIHTRYKELKKEDFVDNPVYIGHKCDFKENDIGEICLYDGNETFPIEEKQEYWLKKIIDLTKERNIDLLLFVSPATVAEKDMKKLNYVEELAKEYDIEVINTVKMVEQLDLDPRTDFLDWAHTNYSGALKVTQYIGEVLSEKYEVADRRDEKGYELWIEDAKVRQHEVDNYLLNLTYEMDTFFAQLSQMQDGYTVIVETNGGYYTDETLMDGYAEMIGIEAFDGKNGVWVLEDGVINLELLGSDFGEYVALGRSDMLINRTEGVSNIIIDSIPHVRAWDGINIIVFDNILGKVVESASFTPVNQYQIMR